jgi:uncharacterized metal-binding protein YceD (DUF177 family)
LKSSEYKEFSLVAGPYIMESCDNEASFEKDLLIKGAATVTTDHLVLNISIDTEVVNYCTICNDPISHPLHVEEKHVAFSLDTMKSGVFSLKEFIRELVFLNLPRFSECHGKSNKEKLWQFQNVKYQKEEEIDVVHTIF